MTSEPGPVDNVCPLCGASNPPGAAHCASCGRSFGPQFLATTNPYEAPKADLGAVVTIGRVLAYLVGVVLILLSTVIAFVATCFPVGMMTANAAGVGGIIIGVVAGLVAAGVTLRYSAKLFNRMMKRNQERTP